ncbi:MAG TPA: NAD-dependent epimerase/dehydratase family protein [Candidatus Edwardsbacteria bacterium]|nr:NAD-dependent epimerase/dehydratase family protein [Candidatus Edwardsbacteria bacterium]
MSAADDVRRTSGATALVTGASALVSGATGFLGGRLVGHLQRAGFKVRVLARPTSDLGKIAGCGVEVVQGDVCDADALRRAAAGQRYVFHTAGKVTDWGRREDFFMVNAGGTARLVAACQDEGVERLVHVSSLTVLGLPRTGAAVNEETPYAQDRRDPYTASKIAAEIGARAAHGTRGLAVTVVRSGVIWGPGDATILPRLAALLRRGRLPYVDGGHNVIGLSHVDNLCEGTILAATNPASAGQLYHITDGEEITARQAIDAIAETMGVPKPSRSLPFWLLYAAAAMMEAGAKLAGRTEPPAITRYGVRLVACDSRYDIAKARHQLGYRPAVAFRDGIQRLGLREAGL